jgi:hypothetical protein
MKYEVPSLGNITQWPGIIFQKNTYLSYTHRDNLKTYAQMIVKERENVLSSLQLLISMCRGKKYLPFL